MRHSLKSIIALLLCVVMLSTTILTSCDSGDSGGGGDQGTSQSTPSDNVGDNSSQNKPSDSKPDGDGDSDDNNQTNNNGGGNEDATVLATGVTLNKTTLSLIKGSSETLTATVAPADATNKNVTWTSSNENVATVSGGTVTAVGAGTATITVTTSNGKTATCEVTVTVIALGVTLDKSSIQLNAGETNTLAATVAPANTTDKSVSWTTSDASVATVANGTVTAVGAGTATITVTTANGKTATCQVTVISNGISFKTLGVTGTEVYGKVSNTTTTFSFINEVGVSGNATFEVYRDLECSDIIRSKTTTLNIGDNTFYILEYIGGEVNALYTVTVRRRPMYTVTFDAKGGTTIAAQTIEEDSFVTVPTTTRTGYTFVGWDRDLTLPITNNTTISAQWSNNPYTVTYNANGGEVTNSSTNVAYGLSYTLETPTRAGYTFAGWYYGATPISITGTWNISESVMLKAEWRANTNTAYKVEHYTEKLDGAYELKYTDNLSGTSDSEVTPATKNYEGFTAPAVQTVTILPDGSQVVKYYYTRNSYTVTFLNDDGTEIETKSLKYEEEYSFSVQSKVGYTFGWYDGNKQFTELSGNWNILRDIVLKAQWTPNPDTAYRVEHYTEKLDGTYELKDTDNLTGTSDSEVTPATKNYEGFTAPVTQTVTVLPDGSQVVVYKYTRNSYTVTFLNDDGTEIETKSLKYEEEYSFSVQSKVGYTFGWYDADKQFTELSGNWTILRDIVLKAQWTPNPDTAYRVKHYTEKLDGTYELKDTDNLSGTSDNETTPNVKTYTGFTSPEKQTVTILPDGSQLVKYYYTRNSYTISFVTNGGNTISSQKIKYEETILNIIPVRDEYTFGGWFTDEKLSVQATTAPADSITLYAYWSEESKPSDFTYSGTDSITITKYTADGTTVCIPTYIAGKVVTSINSSAFANCTKLASITIPDSVTSIDTSTFYGCTGLTSITIPNSVTSIGSSAFYGCTGLTSITIPNSVTSIGKSTFSGCTGLTEINFNATAMNDLSSSNYVFAKAGQSGSGITVNIGANVTKIPAYLFYPYSSSSYTPNIKSVVFAEGSVCESIGSYAFSGCKGLTSVTIPDSVTSIGDDAFRGCSSLTSVTIPDSVTSIGSSAFSGCSSLTRVTIPDSVTSIGDYAFSGCTGLTEINFNATLMNDDPNDVFECAGQSGSGITVNIGANVTKIPAYLFDTYYSDDTHNIKSVVFAEGSVCESIGERAFYNCSSLTSITIPDSVTSIGDSAFSGCSKLVQNENGVHYVDSWVVDCDTSVTKVVLRENTRGIGDYAFYYFTGITSITIPDSVTSIGKFAFDGCSSLTSITIPDSVTSIGKGAFRGCRSLTSITLPFVGATKDGTSNTHFGYIFYASAYYYNDSYVPTSLKTVVITGGTSIDEGAFWGCSSLTSVTIPNSVTSIGSSAFDDCSSLTSVYITDIAAWCNIDFEGYSSNPLYYANNLYLNGVLVTDLVIPDSVTSIGEDAFYNCSSLTSVTIPDSVTSIGSSAFMGCSSLTSITVETGNTKYHSEGNCLIETNSKTLIGGCKSSIIPSDGSVTSIGNCAFYDCSSLTSITIPDSVTSIGNYAFYYCSNLTSITIPDSVTSIGEDAFYYCSNLTSITFSGTVTKWDAIIKGYNWNSRTGSYTIYFTDMAIAKDGTVYYPVYTYTVNKDKTTCMITGVDLKSIAEIVIPEYINGYKVTSIYDEAFYCCSDLTSITLPDSITSIGHAAFAFCTGLTSITIPNSVTSISNEAFGFCTGLTSITIPDSVTSIGEYAFCGCSGLTKINFNGTMAQWNAISKGSYWSSNTGKYTIYCTDGNISK